MKKLSVLALVGVVALTSGCANVHEFINGDFLNTVSPNTATVLKTAFYSDRYEFNVAPERVVPKDFANSAGDTWENNRFVWFTKNESTPGQFMANYYDPNFTKNGDIATVHVKSFSRVPEKTKSGKYYNSTDDVYQYNCSNSTYAAIKGIAYSGHNLDGSIVSNVVLPKKAITWTTINPDSLESRIFNKVCK